MSENLLWSPSDVPVQALGLMRLSPSDEDDRDPFALMREALDMGVSLFDTAELYGNEELVGKAIAGRRDEVTLCTKFGVIIGESGDFDDWSVQADPASVHRSCEASLRRLGVDTIDLYYLHHRSDETPIEDTVGAMAELVEAGKVRALGLSNVTVDDVRRAHAVHPIQAVQEQWSLSSRGVEPMLPILAELGITLVAHSPLGHGSLAAGAQNEPLTEALARVARGRSATAAQVALAWVHHQGSRRGQPVVPLPGATRISRLRANIAASRIELSPADLHLLDGATTPP